MTQQSLYIVKASEPVLVSWARDAVSFGGLVGSAVALNTLMPPSGWINFALAIAWLLWMVGRGIKLRIQKTPDEARAWLDENYPQGPVA